jgi:hypothetical protein
MPRQKRIGTDRRWLEALGARAGVPPPGEERGIGNSRGAHAARDSVASRGRLCHVWGSESSPGTSVPGTRRLGARAEVGDESPSAIQAAARRAPGSRSPGARHGPHHCALPEQGSVG